MRPDSIPQELRNLPQWVLWKVGSRSGKPTKFPYQVNGEMAKSDDPTTWTTFEKAMSSIDGYKGVGFVFSESDPYCGIDLDGCREPQSGKVSEWAREIIKRFDSYSEVSPSQTGVKIFVRGKLPFDNGKKVSVDTESVCDKEPGIEAYDHVRYFAVTGLRLSGVSQKVEFRQEAIDWLSEKFFKEVSAPFVPQQRMTYQAGVLDRAAKYIAKLPPAIDGQGGHNATFHAACVLILGFNLSESEAYQILLYQYNPRCQPPWSEKELQHKVRSAAKQPGPRGYLRDVEPQKWSSVKVPEYVDPEHKPVELITLESSVEKYIQRVERGTGKLLPLEVPDVDYAIGGGCEKGELVVVAARPSHGKSAFALQVVHSATSEQVPSLIISEEMSSIMLGKRTLQYMTDIPEEHWTRSTEKLRRDAELFFEKRSHCYVAESCGSIDAAERAIREAVKNRGVQLVAVDYAQLLRSSGKSRYEQVTNTSITLRGLASELGIVVLMLAQLSRGVEERARKSSNGAFIPCIADIKDTGQIEQDADVILLLCWPHRLDPRKPANEFLVWVGKNRNRAIMQQSVKCRFLPSRQRFEIEKPKAIEVPHYSEFDEWGGDDFSQTQMQLD